MSQYQIYNPEMLWNHTLTHFPLQDLDVFGTHWEGNFWLSSDAILLNVSSLKPSLADARWSESSLMNSSTSVVVHNVQFNFKGYGLPKPLPLPPTGTPSGWLPLRERLERRDSPDDCDLLDGGVLLPVVDITAVGMEYGFSLHSLPFSHMMNIYHSCRNVSQKKTYHDYTCPGCLNSLM